MLGRVRVSDGLGQLLVDELAGIGGGVGEPVPAEVGAPAQPPTTSRVTKPIAQRLPRRLLDVTDQP